MRLLDFFCRCRAERVPVGHTTSSQGLRTLEIEAAMSKGDFPPLTEAQVAEMKRPLYDHFDPGEG